MFQDINDLKIKSNAFFIAMAEKCADGWMSALYNTYTLYDPNKDFCHAMLHGSNPVIPLPPFQKNELFELSYHASVDVFAPLLKTGEDIEIVISILNQVTQSYNWEQFYKQSFDEIIRHLNKKPHLRAILDKSEEVQKKRDIGFTSRPAKDDNDIRKVAEELISMFEQISPSEEKKWLLPLFSGLISNTMAEQQEMAQRMLQKLDSVFGLDHLNDNTVEITKSSSHVSDLTERVALFREQQEETSTPLQKTKP